MTIPITFNIVDSSFYGSFRLFLFIDMPENKTGNESCNAKKYHSNDDNKNQKKYGPHFY